MPQCILPNQTASIKGRLLIENTLLASEIVQGYHKKGGPKRITIKVDIAKAFDTIRWQFIFKCLRGLDVPELFLRWLEACVCTLPTLWSLMVVSMSISKVEEDYDREIPYHLSSLFYL